MNTPHLRASPATTRNLMTTRTTLDLAEQLASVEARIRELELLPLVETAAEWVRLSAIKAALHLELGARHDGLMVVSAARG